ncbi:MAG TPA: hypothetical protein VFG63_03275 [Nocardioidaceae bacterium]|nr:hypothetical protein [Nocardioidaceae bacterium]
MSPAPEKVYLHVGAPKTGTTYLQDRLALNRSTLAEHDVHYPLGMYASHFKAALDLINVSWGGQLEEARGEWDALVARAQRQSGTVIISHEILAAAKPNQVKRAMAAFADSEVHLVYSARDLARQIPAEWQEGVKHRRSRSFGRFLSQVQSSPRAKSNMWFWRVQGLPDVLSRWSRGMAPENVHLVTLPQPGAPRGLLWDRFCQVFGIDPSWAPEDSERINNSIGIAETTLLRKLNRRFGKKLGNDDYRTLVRQMVVHDTLAHRGGMQRATLPPAMYPWAGEVAEEWIEWIEGSGIDVVGDVDELRPRPPAPGMKWVNPDRPKRTDMVDAALDALVALTHEAAERPDRAEQITAKIGRAARRLRGQ